MKQFLFLATFAVALFSCTGNQKQAEATDVAFGLDNLLAVAEQEVDNTITVVGFVTHTCKHSGKKCFIVGESQTASLRVEVEPEGEIDVFTPDLIGSKVAITGVLKEQHLSSEYIDEMENEVKQQQKEGIETEEVCATELSNISDMRQWMKDRGKDYYAIYYMDGLKYEVLDLKHEIYALVTDHSPRSGFFRGGYHVGVWYFRHHTQPFGIGRPGFQN